MKLTCGALKSWLDKMPEDAEVRFVYHGDGGTPGVSGTVLEMLECAPAGRTYRIDLIDEE